ncbi:hypothetical protein WIW50_14260 [Flavobacteriaceae bacterium 3-367]
MKNRLLLIFLCIGYIGMSQIELNDYKYVIVPKQFDSFKKENQYQTSTFIKYLLTQKGFNTVYDDEMPDDVIRDRCLGLLVDLIDDSSLFATKTSILFKDCGGKEIFLTQEGRSKLKEFKPSYMEAIRKNFESLDGFTYSYKPKESTTEVPTKISFKDDVKQLEKEEPAPVETAAKEVREVVVEQEVTPEDQTYKSVSPKVSEIKKGEAKPSSQIMVEATKETNILYAQQIANGYQLVDSTPQIKLKMFGTTSPNVYLAVADDKNGMVHSKDGKWFFEYYEDGQLRVEELQIKF